ncbi:MULTISPECIES: hypothetical protein [unclassified Nocardioides]|uniref:hypothetical protein n=1 Tax=unclassified Nocardioides TaxID=2615069 RepID=UPI0006FD5A55|nr:MULTISPECIES: hypothetical protein [unclassified Nocardioides]KRA32716.1 hypothetical protein ASD81_14455 [Nocardioides sp. Root614]KRA89368.1 hypothetical protein ASD84_14720 [Nocardioides sp. Root682]
MSDTLELRLPAPAGQHSPLRPVAVALGFVLAGSMLVAIGTQDLDSLDQLEAIMTAAAGLLILGWGVAGLFGNSSRLRYDAILRLDGDGIALHSGAAGDGGWAHLAWYDLARVEVHWWEIVPPFLEDPEHLPVLRFISRDESYIQVAGDHVQSRALAGAFQVSPASAALIAVLDHAATEPLQQLGAWLNEHQGEVPVEIGAPPNL